MNFGIIGAGGLGSNVARAMARKGLSATTPTAAGRPRWRP